MLLSNLSQTNSAKELVLAEVSRIKSPTTTGFSRPTSVPAAQSRMRLTLSNTHNSSLLKFFAKKLRAREDGRTIGKDKTTT